MSDGNDDAVFKPAPKRFKDEFEKASAEERAELEVRPVLITTAAYMLVGGLLLTSFRVMLSEMGAHERRWKWSG